MDAPLALYRRYRPETFAEVIGQDHVTEPLRHALAANRVNHAYLFSGPRGCGKTTSARILARAMNCEKAPVADGLAIYGPAPAPLAMLRGRHRFRLLLHAPRSFDLQGAIRDWVGRIDWPAKARLAIDIDPYSFV